MNAASDLASFLLWLSVILVLFCMKSAFYMHSDVWQTNTMQKWVISPPGMPFLVLILPKRKPNVGVLEFGCWSPDRNLCSLCTGGGGRGLGEFWAVGTVEGSRQVQSELLLNGLRPKPRCFYDPHSSSCLWNTWIAKGCVRGPCGNWRCVWVEYFLTCFHLSWKKPVCCLAVSWHTSCAKWGCKYPSLDGCGGLGGSPLPTS